MLGGCAAWSTYPPIETARTPSLKPANAPLPEVMRKALAFTHQEYARVDDLVFNLPEGTPPRVYEDITDRLGYGRPLTEPQQPAYHIEQVRVRGTKAEVDIILPSTQSDMHQVATIFLGQRIGSGYFVERSRLWRIRVEAPPPNYPQAVELVDANADESETSSDSDSSAVVDVPEKQEWHEVPD